MRNDGCHGVVVGSTLLYQLAGVVGLLLAVFTYTTRLAPPSAFALADTLPPRRVGFTSFEEWGTLSRQLQTKPLLVTHVPVGYRRGNGGFHHYEDS